MTQFIRTVGELTQADVPFCGTKACTLGELQRADFKVPLGIVLTTAAYSEFIAPIREKILARLTDNVIMDPAEIETAAEEIRAEIQALPFPSGLHDALERALEDFSEAEKTSLIARTSTPSDDLATSFGSGVARAYLGLVGVEELERAAAKCWAALWNSRSMYFRHRKKIVQTDVALAVLVQPMIRADSAGVMFTQNAMTNDRTVVQVRSIWGLGAPLTSARFRPDEFLVSKQNGSIAERTIEDKYVKLVVGEDGHIEEHAVPEDRVAVPSLSDEELAALAKKGQEIERFFGAPQDIEWAISEGTIFIVQARPIGVRTA